MNTDETTVDQTETGTETTTETVETVVEETTADPIDGIEDIAELRKIAKAQRSIAQRYKKDVKQSKPQIINEGASKSYNILDDDVADLLLEGYTKDDVRFIVSNGGRKALEDSNSYVSIAIKSKLEQRKAEKAAAQTSNVSGASEVDRKYTPEQLKNMSRSELEKILPHA